MALIHERITFNWKQHALALGPYLSIQRIPVFPNIGFFWASWEEIGITLLKFWIKIPPTPTEIPLYYRREGNVFASVCHSFCPRGACMTGGGMHAGETVTEAGSTHHTGMHSCSMKHHIDKITWDKKAFHLDARHRPLANCTFHNEEV